MPHVIVLGSSNTDMTVRVPSLPHHGQTVLGGTFESGPGGKGANQAVAARRAGAPVFFVTAVGDDSLGREALQHYRREGIDVTSARVIPNVASGVALIFVEEGGENMIAVAPGANSQLSPKDIDQLPSSLFELGSVFLASLEVPLDTVLNGLRRARAAGMTTILNPAPADRTTADQIIKALSWIDILTPNQSELRALAGEPEEANTDPLVAAKALQKEHPHLKLVITLGSRGCIVVEQEAVFVPARRVEAVDAVGAGDAFNGALAVALVDGLPLLAAAEWASDAAALSVTHAGAQAGLPQRNAIEQIVTQPKRPSQIINVGESISGLGL